MLYYPKTYWFEQWFVITIPWVGWVVPANGFARAHSFDRKIQMFLIICPAVHVTVIWGFLVLHYVADSNRLDLVSLNDSLRVAFQESMSSSFKFSQDPCFRKLKIFSLTSSWSTLVTKPVRFEGVEKHTLPLKTLWLYFQSTIQHISLLHWLVSCLFRPAILRYNWHMTVCKFKNTTCWSDTVIATTVSDQHIVFLNLHHHIT